MLSALKSCMSKVHLGKSLRLNREEEKVPHLLLQWLSFVSLERKKKRMNDLSVSSLSFSAISPPFQTSSFFHFPLFQASFNCFFHGTTTGYSLAEKHVFPLNKPPEQTKDPGKSFLCIALPGNAEESYYTLVIKTKMTTIETEKKSNNNNKTKTKTKASK